MPSGNKNASKVCLSSSSTQFSCHFFRHNERVPSCPTHPPPYGPRGFNENLPAETKWGGGAFEYSARTRAHHIICTRTGAEREPRTNALATPHVYKSSRFSPLIKTQPTRKNQSTVSDPIPSLQMNELNLKNHMGLLKFDPLFFRRIYQIKRAPQSVYTTYFPFFFFFFPPHINSLGAQH